jgi:hypothetical protein
VSREHLQSSGLIDPQHIVEEQVQAKHLMDIIHNDYAQKNIDLFQVDTEGYDWEILKMLDLSKYTPRFIKLEYVNLSAEEISQVKSLLHNNGYVVYFEGLDLIGIH